MYTHTYMIIYVYMSTYLLEGNYKLMKYSPFCLYFLRVCMALFIQSFEYGLCIDVYMNIYMYIFMCIRTYVYLYVRLLLSRLLEINEVVALKFYIFYACMYTMF